MSSSRLVKTHRELWNAATRWSSILIIGLIAGILSSCTKKSAVPTGTPADSAMIVKDNLAHRAEVDTFFRSDAGSPFLRDTSITYKGIKWFPIDTRFRCVSLLQRYAHQDTVIVLGTKGEERRQVKYGFFTITVPGDNGQAVTLTLNAYKFTPYDAKRYALYKNALSVWFTDKTTGIETYAVGRYVDVGDEDPDPEHEYVIDLNKAYNPYCAYSHLFSCAIPRKEDRIEIALRVGEKNYQE